MTLSLQIYAALFGLGVGVYKVHVGVHYTTMFMFAQYVKKCRHIMNFIDTCITPLSPKGRHVECVYCLEWLHEELRTIVF